MTVTEELRRLLDERGVEWWCGEDERKTYWRSNGLTWEYFNDENGDAWLGFLGACESDVTPEQVIAATLGREPWVNPTWERWHKSLRHDEIKSIGDAVEQLMYEAIEFGGDMGPNGNTYNGIDEGDVLTSGFINEWVARFESTLGRDRYSYEQWREISNAVGDAMEYAYNKAIECPDRADPLWNLDEYVNHILKAAFEGEATLGSSNCTNGERTDRTCRYELRDGWFVCSNCGRSTRAFEGKGDPLSPPNFCPNCGARVEVDA